ncbi:MAG: hypothetical protein PWQ54_1548 [Bacteroidales bacterium]|jgi:hypothetical protein|nr:hypothetical protein [Bacteroidales bacterium]
MINHPLNGDFHHMAYLEFKIIAKALPLPLLFFYF